MIVLINKYQVELFNNIDKIMLIKLKNKNNNIIHKLLHVKYVNNNHLELT
jgi:hypothetical protein